MTNRRKYRWWMVAIVLNLGAAVAIGQLIPEGKSYSAPVSAMGGFALVIVDLAVLAYLTARHDKHR